MKQMEIKLLLPYNWAHARRIRVSDDAGNLLVKIAHNEHLLVQVDDNCKHVVIKLDFYKSVIAVPDNTEKLFLGLYMDFRDHFPHKYIDTFKRKCLTGHFMTAETFDNFDLSFYENAREYLPTINYDNASVFLGLLISAGLVITSVVQQENPYQDLLFFIGVSSLISLLMVRAEKGKILLYDYKSRLVATALAFVLAFIFITPSFAINMVFFLFISLYIIRLLTNLKTIKSA
jgi:hypothetical protein